VPEGEGCTIMRAVCVYVCVRALAATGLQILVNGNVPEGEGCTVMRAVCVCVCECMP